ncbi:hypothetical protein DL93DRAFT_2101420 [Clavulina sp. PMI_390]|nr:hypothetical protein DL93DRAFT_2101420 [Clavulina sp. PMI_390]
MHTRLSDSLRVFGRVPSADVGVVLPTTRRTELSFSMSRLTAPNRYTSHFHLGVSTTLKMEKEFLKEKGESLPIPALQQQASEDAARAAIASTRRRRAFRFLAAAGLMVLLGSTAFSYFHRSLERQRGLSDLPDRRGRLTVSEVEEHFLSIPDSESAIATSKQYATLPHLAGSDQDFETAKDFLSLLQTELGIRAPKDLPVYDAGSPESQSATHGIVKRFHRSAWIDKYYPVMNTPLDRALEVVDDDDGVIWKADVDETPDPKDPASEHTFEVGAWHGLSAAGDVTGPAVYVNYGRKKDYDELAAAGVNLTGTIAIARYGGVFRGLKIKAAQEAGCIGALIYTDPRDHGTVTEEAGYLPYPHGPAVNPNSVQRGSVQYLSSYPGDPTTPGEPSYPNATRTEGGNIPKIPSLPVSWNNGLHILKEINPASPFTMDGTLSKRRIRLQNLVDTRVMPIWNTMGVIPGHIRDEVVVLGNHRDAWVMGAADPTSGTVTMVEIVKGLGHLLRKGWRPLRTIVIASWDAEEYGLIGSTEWGEDFADFLKEHVVAYLNVDVSVSGSRFNIGGSPSLAHLIRGVAQSLAHPTEANRTLWDARDDRGPFKGIAGSVGAQAEVGEDFRMAEELRASMDADELSTGVHPLGSGSDYTVFLQRIGIAAIDGGFGATLSDAVYHYHSVYDSQQFQEQYADPGFLRHVAVAKYLGLVTLRVADSIILPLNTTQYALELGSYLAKVEKLATENSLSTDFSSLHHAISKLAKSSYALDEAKDKAEKEFRKALSKIRLPHRDGMNRSTRAARRTGCTKRTWAKFRNWVKAMFGVRETEHANVHPHPHHPHPHHHEEPVPEALALPVVLSALFTLVQAGHGPRRLGSPSHQVRGPSKAASAHKFSHNRRTTGAPVTPSDWPTTTQPAATPSITVANSADPYLTTLSQALNMQSLSSWTATYTGDLTYYDTGVVACGDTYTDSTYTAAISHLLYDSWAGYAGTNTVRNPVCGPYTVGRNIENSSGAWVSAVAAGSDGGMIDIGGDGLPNCHTGAQCHVPLTATVTNPATGLSVVVQIVDRCTGCAMGDIDLTPTAFSAIGDMNAGRISGITWHFNAMGTGVAGTTTKASTTSTTKASTTSTTTKASTTSTTSVATTTSTKATTTTTSAAATTTSSSSSGSCSGISAWSSTTAYNGGSEVTYGGYLWTNSWWSYDDVPGGSAGVWVKGSAC